MKYYENALHIINSGNSLSRVEAFSAMKSIFQEAQQDLPKAQMQMGMLLYGLSVKLPKIEEILGLVDAIKEVDPGFSRKKMHPQCKGQVVGVSGGGKKGIKTINVSTASSIVAATVGAYVAKPVSRSTSSLMGSTDILESFGGKLNIATEDMVTVMQQTGFGAFSIESNIPKFDSVYGGNFYVSHALSYVLSALVNPIECDSYVHGITSRHVDVAAGALRELGCQRGIAVSSSPDDIYFIDELSPLRQNWMATWGEGRDVEKLYVDAQKMLESHSYESQDLSSATNKEEQIKIFSEILSGKEQKAYSYAVCMNSAIILTQSNPRINIKKAFDLSKDILVSGKPMKKLLEFCEKTVSYDCASLEIK